MVASTTLLNNFFTASRVPSRFLMPFLHQFYLQVLVSMPALCEYEDLSLIF